ncbi:hypothetical protein AAZX31_08G163300 [Glycine max]|uniref:Transglycosylase SLT domain-containing protein n=3 Tax=Glycine max TaxID=3847 RepID=K7L752_SOYBN|nr:hypothetical protein JHK86_021577 [Glycine max]KAH1051561.1 hypothetical protein GYH30_021455 [Glycine max]KRH43695.1 hypothetical protein GLYMA_08G165100v4 [Glycine max]
MLSIPPLLTLEGKFISSSCKAFWSLSQLAIILMAISFSYWDDCVDPQNFEAMWNVPEVSAEWIKAGEQRCQKVHLSRDPDGQPYLTQTEMRAVADIIITKHFHSEIDPDMICAIAELESDRQLLVMNSRHKSKEPTVGLMQLLPKTTEWLMSELGYCSYEADENREFLFKPFVNVYFGAAYIKWLSNFENKKRSEEFIVRAYKGGTKKATHKSTLRYWNCYLSVKESFRSRKSVDDNVSPPAHSHPLPSLENSKDASVDTYWDSRVAPEDMEAMWNHLEVRKEWNKSKQKQGKVRFAHDEKKRPYLSRVEMKAIADIILYKYLSTVKIKSTVICAIGEVLSKRFLHGVGEQPGIMGIDYSTAYWLYLELGYRAYRLESVDDLNNPFVSMYFGAAYVAWLSEYEGRERPPDFFVQAYFVGPKNVNPQDTSTLWLKFEETLSKYEETKRSSDSCSIM